MMDAKFALYVNYHIMVDKCEKCTKEPSGDISVYCQTVYDFYKTSLKEYASAGTQMEMAACGKCMGMGKFSSIKKDGSYLTQEEYDKAYEQQ